MPRAEAGFLGDLLGGGGGVAGATEWTQIANNVELMAVNTSTYQTWAESIKNQINTYQSYLHGVQNLAKLPGDAIREMSNPYAGALGALVDLKVTLDDFQRAGKATTDMLSGRLNEASGLNMTVAEYFNKEMQLAQYRGGNYQRRIEQDLALIDNLKLRSAQLKSATDKTQAITGNLEGLQLLNQQTTMQVGELVDIKAAILAQNISRNQERSVEEAQKAALANVQSISASEAKKRRTRNESLNVGLPAPWSVSIVPGQ
jgi:P-type conjugative transfer protein TrbJ